MRILMIAAENDGIPKAKVGGIGDVVRDVPPVLAQKGHEVIVVVPSYGYLHDLPGSQLKAKLAYRFGGEEDGASLYEVPGRNPQHGVTQYVIDHPAFISLDDHGRFEIYHPDPDTRPFATDASKYARFCMAAAQGIKTENFGRIDCLHLHDWHAACVLMLREFDTNYCDLKAIRTVYTIHNLALQGVRPFAANASSLDAWYPGLKYDRDKLADPRWPDCENPAEAGIRLADMVHTVSPSYAKEIVKASDEPRYYGGVGLHDYLRTADAQGRLKGILNGCEYPENRVAPKLKHNELVGLLKSNVLRWAASETSAVSPAHLVALSRLADFALSPPKLLLTAVSRIVEQKAFLFKARGSNCSSGIEGVLDILGDNGQLVILGSGGKDYEQLLLRASAKYSNFVFLNGYSNECAAALYANGDLFLMPSSFEPCGISQMLAMRDGQPCVAHAVGGLKDTVINNVNGFTFGGEKIEEQVDGFVAATLRAIWTRLEQPKRWEEICNAASAARFWWSDSVDEYVRLLYTP